jgi:hypothetical protein
MPEDEDDFDMEDDEDEEDESDDADEEEESEEEVCSLTPEIYTCTNELDRMRTQKLRTKRLLSASRAKCYTQYFKSFSHVSLDTKRSIAVT